MINKLIKELEICFKNELYMSALIIAMILPDICGKAEYPNEKTNNIRYKKWFEKYVCIDDKILNKEDFYKLRNNIIHQGTPALKNKDNIEKFELLIPTMESCRKNMYSILTNTDTKKRIISINIEYICTQIVNSVTKYYINNKDKFYFINYNITTIDNYTSQIFEIDKR